MKKHILCIGDSNTHGLCTDPSESADHGSRYNEEERWTCLLQKALGEEYLVIEEGLSGRTCVYDDPDMDSVNLLPVLHALLNAMMTQYAALIPRFYVLVNRAGNAMHILPLFLKEDSSQFYECPSDFFYSDRHTIFTRDFESIHMVLTTATIYYYGIDTATYEPKVTMLSYSQTDDCFHIDNGIQDGHIKAFEKELEKEALYLKHNAQ